MSATAMTEPMTRRSLIPILARMAFTWSRNPLNVAQSDTMQGVKKQVLQHIADDLSKFPDLLPGEADDSGVVHIVGL